MMHPDKILFLLLALLGIAEAALFRARPPGWPFPWGRSVSSPARRQSSGGFSVPLVRNEAFRPNGELSLARARLRRGEAFDSLPLGLKAALSPYYSDRSHMSMSEDSGDDDGENGTTTASVPAEPASGNDVEFVVPVAVGNPVQTLQLILDTGSSDLWVMSTELPSNETATGQSLYNSSNSTTASQLEGASWSVDYTDGSGAGGDVYLDLVTVGNLSIRNQAVQAASHVTSQILTDGYADGILGMAFGQLNTIHPQRQQTFFENAMSVGEWPEGEVIKGVFTADLRHSGGSYSFGCINNSLYNGTIHYTPINTSNGLWQFNTTYFFSNATAANDNKTVLTLNSIADTGSTFIHVPKVVMDDYYAHVDGSYWSNSIQAYTYYCDANMPDFVFGIGGGGNGTDAVVGNITVPGRLVTYTSVWGSPDRCIGSIQTLPGGDDESDGSRWVAGWGLTAMKAAFVVFDVDNSQVGWASKPNV